MALQEQRRPVLILTRGSYDPEQKIMFFRGQRMGAGRWEAVPPSSISNGVVYLAVSLRNVGAGIGVLPGWCRDARSQLNKVDGARSPRRVRLPDAAARSVHPRRVTSGLWQGALRDADDPSHGPIAQAIAARETMRALELLYSDQVGGQRTISRFGLMPVGDDGWIAAVNRHWYLDRDGPR